jgi:hypothetical protein
LCGNQRYYFYIYKKNQGEADIFFYPVYPFPPSGLLFHRISMSLPTLSLLLLLLPIPIAPLPRFKPHINRLIHNMIPDLFLHCVTFQLLTHKNLGLELEREDELIEKAAIDQRATSHQVEEQVVLSLVLGQMVRDLTQR